MYFHLYSSWIINWENESNSKNRSWIKYSFDASFHYFILLSLLTQVLLTHSSNIKLYMKRNGLYAKRVMQKNRINMKKASNNKLQRKITSKFTFNNFILVERRPTWRSQRKLFSSRFVYYFRFINSYSVIVAKIRVNKEKSI